MLKKIITLLSIILFLSSLQARQNICIVIPAYNEEKRIEKTIDAYIKYFKSKPEKTTFLVVTNNCSDNTVPIVDKLTKKYNNLKLLNLKPGGKGFAVKQGFLWALHYKTNFDLIGFVDADMATQPKYYYDLIKACKNHDGAIASRYVAGANIAPKRPIGRVLGGKLYNWILRVMFGVKYKDTQCGAKIFTKDTVDKVAPHMHETGWSFDLEFLYLCKLFNKDIAEIPTTWSDQPGSHLTISSKLAKEFLNSPKRIKQRHKKKKAEIKLAEKQAKKEARLRQKKDKKQSKLIAKVA